MTRTLTLKAATPFLLLIAATGLAAPFAGTQDYTALPAFAGYEQQLRDVKITLAQAIEIAQKETNGIAKTASLSLGDPPTIEVLVYGGGKGYHVNVDAATGKMITKSEMSPLPGDQVSGSFTTTPSGLVYADLKPGTGAQPSGPDATVVVNYTVWFTDGTKLDSSLDKGQPASLPLGRMIQGWIEGVGSMKVGGKRKLIVPASLAWGDMGRPPSIPPKATVVFDVELLSVIEPPPPAPPASSPASQPK